MTKRTKAKVLFVSRNCKSFFVYYFIGCLLFLGAIYTAKYFIAPDQNIELLMKQAVLAAGMMTVIVCVVAPILLLRNLEINEERVVIQWALINKKKCIPLCLIDRYSLMSD
jgi:hypothetical protein